MDSFLIIKDYRSFKAKENGLKTTSCKPVLPQKKFKYSSFFWTAQEHRIYVQFLKDHQKLIEGEGTIRAKRIFSSISQLLGCRTSTQVKSHHQKMLKRWKNIQNIIRFSVKGTRRWTIRSIDPSSELPTIKTEDRNDESKQHKIDEAPIKINYPQPIDVRGQGDSFSYKLNQIFVKIQEKMPDNSCYIKHEVSVCKFDQQSFSQDYRALQLALMWQQYHFNDYLLSTMSSNWNRHSWE